MVDWPLILAGLGSLVPALLVLFVSYGAYDGHFRDNILFLFLMGGFVAGMAFAFFECLLILPVCSGTGGGNPLFIIGMVMLGIPILESLLKLVVLNRRQFQGERTTLFYGGAFGLGFAAMLVLFKSQREVPLLMYADLGVVLGAPARLFEFLALGLALLLAHFATGIMVGEGVRTRRLPGAVLFAVLALAPLQFLAFEFTANLRAGRGSEGFLYAPLMLAYTIVLAWYAHAKLLPNALPPDAKRQRRRLLRREAREEAEL